MTYLRASWRSLRSTPSATVTAVTVMALGIWGVLVIFALVDAVVLRGVPFPEGPRLVVVGERPDYKVVATGNVDRRPGLEAPQNLLEWRSLTKVFETVEASRSASLAWASQGRSDRLRVQMTTPRFIEALGVAPLAGRTFGLTAEADARIAVLDYGFAMRSFGSVAGAVGKTLDLDRGPYTIVGVMPRDFSWPVGQSTDAYIPYVISETDRTRSGQQNHDLRVVARLTAGTSVTQAADAVAQRALAVASQFPDWFRTRKPAVMSLKDYLVGDVQVWMYLLLGSITMLLVIAAVNAATIMFTRAVASHREISVRVALGASMLSVLRGFLIENTLLSLGAAAMAISGAWITIPLMQASLPPTLPHVATLALTYRVVIAGLVASSAVAAFSTLVAMSVPLRADVATALRSARSESRTRAARQTTSILIMCEVGVAVVLLAGAGLFVSSFTKVVNVDLGFDRSGILTLSVAPPVNYRDPAAVTAARARVGVMVPELLERLRLMPGVQSAAAVTGTDALGGTWSSQTIDVDGVRFTGPDSIFVHGVTPDYAKTLGLRVIAGRFIDSEDAATSAPVVVLDETAATRYFHGTNPIGHTIGLKGQPVVIGVIQSPREGGPEADLRPGAYCPLSQTSSDSFELYVRTATQPTALAQAVKTAAWSVAPDVPLANATSLEELFDRLVARRRFNMIIFAAFGFLALSITCVGIYGVVAHSVEQRRGEIGLRLALGASRSRILWAVTALELKFVAAGIAIGLIGAWLLARTAQAYLFRVSPSDPRIYCSVVLVFVTTAIVAAWIPTREALGVDPAVALSHRD